MLILSLYAIGGCLVNYFRGGNLNSLFPFFAYVGGNKARALAAAWFAWPFALVDLPVYPASVLGLSFDIPFLLLTIWVFIWGLGFAFGWGLYANMGPNDPNEKEVAWIDWVLVRLSLTPVNHPLTYDTVGLSLRGLHFSVPVVALLLTFTTFDAWGYAFAGLAMGPLRYLTKDIPNGWGYWEFIFGGYLALMFWGMAHSQL